MSAEEVKGKERVATIWSWGEEFEDVGKNCKKYVSKKWDENIREGSVMFLARERNEGIVYYVTAFVNDPKNIGDLAQRLFEVVLFQGDTKIYHVGVRLSDPVSSDTMQYRDSMEEVESELKKLEEKIAEKFSEDPKIKEAAKGRKVEFIPEVYLLCELESKWAIKIVVEVIHHFFSNIKEFLDSFTNKLIGDGLAERVLGYKLDICVDDLEIEDVEAQNDEAVVLLTQAKVVTK